MIVVNNIAQSVAKELAEKFLPQLKTGTAKAKIEISEDDNLLSLHDFIVKRITPTSHALAAELAERPNGVTNDFHAPASATKYTHARIELLGLVVSVVWLPQQDNLVSDEYEIRVSFDDRRLSDEDRSALERLRSAKTSSG